MAHFLCHLGCSHFGALLLDFHFTENNPPKDPILTSILIQKVITAWLTKELTK